MSDKVRAALRGISGVHVTAWKGDGEADWTLTGKIVAGIAQAGIHNIVSAGNTGEFYPMTTDEVVRSHAVAAEAAAGKALVTAGIGRSLREAIATGKLAAKAGCDAVMVHHPLDPFAAPQSQADYILTIAEALTIPLVAYIRSDAIGVKDLACVATHPNVAGVKFASPNMMLLAECVRATQGSSANWICGLAEGWAAPFHALGARGFTSGLVNVAPERSLAIWQALEANNYELARRLVDEIAGFETLRTKYGNGANVTVVKEALGLLGTNVGPVRLPGLPELNESERAELRKIVGSWGSQRAAAE
ncbi:Dihydrodipicolinate synthase [Bosea sp. 62]|uniref:dihydrodipicolinate synthase family protein n=1 Tax=unclassified Bosea (in: a-proteobacteria) TaxID=2653178 RepID=UPI00125978CC|nr:MULTISPECIES: dihydrodipicolinate synthase family protein [unclassified Bosea (in: a-proteobacteria)]CAD5255390.1 Dihydrodipicolinate synthase [Bosea sp. 7B]CAD5275440.1 Dihydrodipicolinate synthase [Bosea sp. 21B]CAD5276544.1 Dihydrodipicolinate synthase [Bosea sp. 46]VVT59992.1 Dihydrodipicolinate synthase [Bosea sp. EC-HK365B]VXB50712.1 Dihydrodipicolinate synthase [Bosea sp. 62]